MWQPHMEVVGRAGRDGRVQPPPSAPQNYDNDCLLSACGLPRTQTLCILLPGSRGPEERWASHVCPREQSRTGQVGLGASLFSRGWGRL